MDTPANAKSANKGFTLVEMLVVITIIGMLMALLLGAVMRSRVGVRNAVIKSEIDQLEVSLQNYKSEFTEFPPTFANVNIVAEQAGDQDLQNAGRAAVVRHLRKAFPRYVPGQRRAGFNPESRPDVEPFELFANDVYYEYWNPATGLSAVDPLRFDAASALVFWLGGLPERRPQEDPVSPTPFNFVDPYVPAGFHADPTFPFGQGLPRTKPLFEFKPDRVRQAEPHYENPFVAGSPLVPRYLRYYPERIGDEAAPYVYFKSHRITAAPFNGLWQYGDLTFSGSPPFCQYWYAHAIEGQPVDNFCVPYRVADLSAQPQWRAHDTFQIIAPGLDGHFGTAPPALASGVPRWRTTIAPNANISNEDYDNLTSFSEGRLEDEM